MTVDVSKLPLSDAEILEVLLDREDVVVRLRLWDETQLSLRFINTSGVEAFSPIGGDLSHCEDDPAAPFLQRTRDLVEDGDAMHCFIFRSAVSGEPVLSVVADQVEHDPQRKPPSR